MLKPGQQAPDAMSEVEAPASQNLEGMQYDEARTYIILEFSLQRPMVPKRAPEELAKRLEQKWSRVFLNKWHPNPPQKTYTGNLFMIISPERRSENTNSNVELFHHWVCLELTQLIRENYEFGVHANLTRFYLRS